MCFSKNTSELLTKDNCMISCFSSECAYLYLLERQHAEQLKSCSFSDLLFPMESRDQNACCSFDLFVLVICAFALLLIPKIRKGIIYVFHYIFLSSGEREKRKDQLLDLQKSKQERTDSELQNLRQVSIWRSIWLIPILLAAPLAKIKRQRDKVVEERAKSC